MPQTLGTIASSHNFNALWTWGPAANGSLGNNTTTPNLLVPTALNEGTDWDLIANGFRQHFAIRNGRLWGWGGNGSYQLGLNDTTNRLVPTQIGSDTNWKSFAVGGGAGGGRVAIKSDGTLWSWGPNTDHRTAQGTSTGNTQVPTQIGSATDWSKPCSGITANAAIKTDGTLWTWGNNQDYQTAQGTNTGHTTTPTKVGSDTNWGMIALGGEGLGTVGAVAIKGGKLFAWGNNTQAITGRGTTTGTTTTPTEIDSNTDWTMVALSNSSHGAGIRAGRLYSWGNNANFRTGQNTSSGFTTTPTQIGSDTDWASVALGEQFGLALKTDGRLYSWGNNAQQPGSTGQNTSTGTTNSPTQVGTATDWKSISVSTSGMGTAGGIKG
jgi:alpha-tubulin suppressor-like RCC1 family protein